MASSLSPMALEGNLKDASMSRSKSAAKIYQDELGVEQFVIASDDDTKKAVEKKDEPVCSYTSLYR